MNAPNRLGENNAIAIVTWSLIILCILVFLWVQAKLGVIDSPITSDLISLGISSPLHIWSGEIWRLVTAIFIHQSVFHLVCNLIILFQIGRIIEPFYGPCRLLLIFIISGILGSCVSILFHSSLSMGASGGVMGLVGALLAALSNKNMRMYERHLLRVTLTFVFANGIFGILLNMFIENIKIDNSAHLGGLLSGIILGLALKGELFSQKKLNMFCKAGVYVAGALLLAICCSALRPNFLPKYHMIMGNESFLDKDYQSAINHSKWLQTDERDWFGTLLEARIFLATGDKTNATDKINKALEVLQKENTSGPNVALASFNMNVFEESLFADETGNSLICEIALSDKTVPHERSLYNDCAWLKLMAEKNEVRDVKKALTWALHAVDRYNEVPSEVLHTLSEAYRKNGNDKEALAALNRAVALDYTKRHTLAATEIKR